MSDAQECESTTKPLHEWAELVLRELNDRLSCTGDGQTSGSGHGVPCKLNKKAPCSTGAKQGARRPRLGYAQTDGRQVANE